MAFGALFILVLLLNLVIALLFLSFCLVSRSRVGRA